MSAIVEYWRAKSFSEKFFLASILIFFAAIPVSWELASNSLYLATLIAIVSLIVSKQPIGKISTIEYVLFFTVIFWVLHALLSWWVNDMPEYGALHIKGRQAKLLFFIPLYLYIRQRGLPILPVLLSVTLGVVIIGVDGIIKFSNNYIAIKHQGFDDGHYIIQLAAIIATLSIYLLFASIAFFKKKIWLSLLFLLGAATGMAYLFLSGSRGAWLGFVFAVMSALFFYREQLGKKVFLSSSVLAVFVLFAVCQIPFVRDSLVRIHTEAFEYFEGSQRQTSSGDRLDLWKHCLILGGRNIMFGVGPGGISGAIQENFPDKEFLLQYEYPHNQFVAAFASRGLPGLLLELLLFGMAGMIFYKALSAKDDRTRQMALAGMILLVSYFIYGLSYDHLEKRLQLAFFSVNLAVLLAMVRRRSSGLGSQEIVE